jgi:polyhydroxyalkanoate synthesis regulator phasin
MTVTGDKKAAIMSCLKEISDSYTRIEAERDLVKEILDRMQEEFEIPKKMGRKIARIYHKRNYEEEVAQQNDLQETYESIVNK